MTISNTKCKASNGADVFLGLGQHLKPKGKAELPEVLLDVFSPQFYQLLEPNVSYSTDYGLIDIRATLEGIEALPLSNPPPPTVRPMHSEALPSPIHHRSFRDSEYMRGDTQDKSQITKEKIA